MLTSPKLPPICCISMSVGVTLPPVRPGAKEDKPSLAFITSTLLVGRFCTNDFMYSKPSLSDLPAATFVTVSSVSPITCCSISRLSVFTSPASSSTRSASLSIKASSSDSSVLYSPLNALAASMSPSFNTASIKLLMRLFCSWVDLLLLSPNSLIKAMMLSFFNTSS